MADLTPNNREEYWLQGMVDGQTTLEPNKRREYWYKEIVDAIGSGGGGGTGGGVLVVGVTMTETTATLDKTWKEIHDASFAVVSETQEGEGSVINKNIWPVLGCSIDNGSYDVAIAVGSIDENNMYVFNAVNLQADSENDYPTATMG